MIAKKMNKINIYLTNTTKFLVLSKKNINFLFIYSNKLFLSNKIENYIITYRKSLNILELTPKTPLNIKNITNFLNNFIFSWDFFFHKKITFTGKGFKLKKKQKILFFFFNKSHISLIICNSAILKKLKQNKILFFYKNIKFYNQIFNKILKIRYANIYTKRGLRFSRQLILKRKGKGGVQPQ